MDEKKKNTARKNTEKKSTKEVDTHAKRIVEKLQYSDLVIKRNIKLLLDTMYNKDDMRDLRETLGIETVTLKDFRTPDRNVMPTDTIIEGIETYFCRYLNISSGSFTLKDINLEEKLTQAGVEFKASVRDVELIKANITALRAHHQESQKDLAEALGISSNAISQYESLATDRLPDIDIMIAMAEHYHITLDDLLYHEFTFNPILIIEINNETISDVLETILPMDKVSEDDPEEEKSPSLLEAFQIHERLYDNILKREAPKEIEEIASIMITYKKAIKKGSKKAIINHLWWLMYYGIAYMCLSDELLSKKEILLISDALEAEGDRSRWKKKRAKYKNSSKGVMEEIQQYFLSAYEELIIEDLFLLKRAGLDDWADYYNALRYIFSIIRNDLSEEMNCTVGKEMMRSLFLMGNKYAIGYYGPDFVRDDDDDDLEEE